MGQGTGLPAGIMLAAAKDSASVPVPIIPAVMAAFDEIFRAAGVRLARSADLTAAPRVNYTALGLGRAREPLASRCPARPL